MDMYEAVIPNYHRQLIQLSLTSFEKRYGRKAYLSNSSTTMDSYGGLLNLDLIHFCYVFKYNLKCLITTLITAYATYPSYAE